MGSRLHAQDLNGRLIGALRLVGGAVGLAMTKFVTTIFMFVIASGFLVAHGQQPPADLFSDSDKAQIIESVLQLELRTQASLPDFATIRQVSDENIEFIEPSRLSNHGLTLVAANQLRESKRTYVVEYLLFRRIHWRAGLAVVVLSRVTEGRPCFGPAFSRQRTYTYESRWTSIGWVTQLIAKPSPLIGLGLKGSATTRWTPGEKPNNSFDWISERVY